MLSALYEAMTGRGPALLRAYFLAVAILTIALSPLAVGAYPQIRVPPFFGLVTALGGVLYGLGMVLAVGCAAAVLYRAGEGKLDYVLATAGFAVGAGAGGYWLTDPIRRVLHGTGTPRTLADVLPVPPWLLAAVVAGSLVAMMSVGRSPGQRPAGGWGWVRTGSLIGVIGVGALAASILTGATIRPGTGQERPAFARVLAGDAAAVDYGVVVMVGILLGSLVASRLHGVSPGKPFRPDRVARSLGGGLLMGFSATLVAGDNLLHGLSGVPLLALSSLVFVPAMFLGAWIGIRLGWLA